MDASASLGVRRRDACDPTMCSGARSGMGCSDLRQPAHDRSYRSDTRYAMGFGSTRLAGIRYRPDGAGRGEPGVAADGRTVPVLDGFHYGGAESRTPCIVFVRGFLRRLRRQGARLPLPVCCGGDGSFDSHRRPYLRLHQYPRQILSGEYL